jgi:hypothetical protein
VTAKLLWLACVLEILTALALIIAPSFVSELILGNGASGTGIALGRVAGFVLLSLGLACYPRSVNIDHLEQPVLGMLTYNTLITAYFMYLGISGGATGAALWLVVAIHAVLTILFAQSWFKERFSSNLHQMHSE